MVVDKERGPPCVEGFFFLGPGYILPLLPLLLRSIACSLRGPVDAPTYMVIKGMVRGGPDYRGEGKNGGIISA